MKTMMMKQWNTVCCTTRNLHTSITLSTKYIRCFLLQGVGELETGRFGAKEKNTEVGFAGKEYPQLG